jgi:ABC-type sugar transport system ATPase subunit
MDIYVEGVSKRFGNNLALENVSLEFGDKTFTCIYGAPGSGKTTLLRVIAGLDFPDTGYVRFGNQDVSLVPPMQRSVSYIAQEFALYPHLTVFKNIAYPLKLKKVGKEAIERKVLEVAKLLKIDHLLNRMPTQLSGGEQQRVAIARGLVRQADVYLFDEPLTNLDYKIREDMRSEFRRFQKELGQTIIYATGDPLEALAISENVVIMKNGRVVEVGKTKEVYLQPSKQYTLEVFGSPRANLFKGSIEKGFFVCPLFSVKCGFETAKMEALDFVAGIRPENFVLFSSVEVDGARNSGKVVFGGRVFLNDIIGSENVILVLAEGVEEPIRILAPRDLRLEIDSEVYLGFDPTNVLFYCEEKFVGRGTANG